MTLASIIITLLLSTTTKSNPVSEIINSRTFYPAAALLDHRDSTSVLVSGPFVFLIDSCAQVVLRTPNQLNSLDASMFQPTGILIADDADELIKNPPFMKLVLATTIGQGLCEFCTLFSYLFLCPKYKISKGFPVPSKFVTNIFIFTFYYYFFFNYKIITFDRDCKLIIGGKQN